MRVGVTVAILLANVLLLGTQNAPGEEVVAEFALEYAKVTYPKADFRELLYVGINRQKLYHLKNDELVSVYEVSTSSHGAGNLLGSNKTPVGLHRIREKIGAGVPVGGVFVGKKYTGSTVEISTTNTQSERDDITSRVLSLEGLELGVNTGKKEIDSYHRKIYIHGTPEEGLIGKPASHGCIRMKNREVIELFKTVSEGTLVLILDN